MSSTTPLQQDPNGSPAVFQAIRDWLEREGVAFRHVHHEPTRTSEESARARGEDLRIGGKALLMKVGESFKLFILSAALKLDSAAIKSHFGVGRMRFARPQELRDLSGLVPGSVPPFGAPIPPFDLFVDESILENEKIAFNAGLLTDSVIMPVADYVRIAKPAVLRFGAR